MKGKMCLQHPRLMTQKEKIHSTGNHTVLIRWKGIKIMRKGKERRIENKETFKIASK